MPFSSKYNFQTNHRKYKSKTELISDYLDTTENHYLKLPKDSYERWQKNSKIKYIKDLSSFMQRPFSTVTIHRI